MLQLTCPRCGRDFEGDDRDAVADDVIRHASTDHGHVLSRGVVLAHLAGRHPDRDEI